MKEKAKTAYQSNAYEVKKPAGNDTNGVAANVTRGTDLRTTKKKK